MGQQPCVCVTVLVLLTQEFTGNSDRDTVVENVLNLPIEAKFIRFQPTAWHGHISMRVELYGCPQCNDFDFFSHLAIYILPCFCPLLSLQFRFILEAELEEK